MGRPGPKDFLNIKDVLLWAIAQATKTQSDAEIQLAVPPEVLNWLLKTCKCRNFYHLMAFVRVQYCQSNRIARGLERARQNGVRIGRPSVHKEQKKREAQMLRAEQHTLAEISQILDVSTTTLSRWLNEDGAA